MQRTKIEWATHTWNPMTGCTFGCKYCYARRITERFPQNFPYGFLPHFYPERLSEKMPQKFARIFTVDMGDFWDLAFTEEERGDIIYRMHSIPQHRFLILTKRPENIAEYTNVECIKFPRNLWLGVTVDKPGTEGRIQKLLENLKGTLAHPFISFEPLLGPVEPNLRGIEWIIIGQQTNPIVKAEPEWISRIMIEAEGWGIPVFQKNNLGILRPTQNYPTDLMFNQKE